MAFRELHYRWEWRLRSSPRELWPLVADTNRFNRDTGVPSVERPPGAAGSLPNARRRLRLFRLGIPVEWEEDPFEWVWPHRFGVVRRYLGGPIALIEDGDTIVVDLNEDRLDCRELADDALRARRAAAWQAAAAQHGGVHPDVKPVTDRLLKRMRFAARPALQGAGMAIG